MLFPTVAFAVFFTIAYTVSWLLRPTYRFWLWVMTALSFVFYGWTDARFVWLLAGSIVVNWGFGELVRRALAEDRSPTAASHNLVRAAVVVNLAFLGFFKYYGFFVDTFADALGALGLDVTPPLLQIALPVGISFFTFHALSYVIDIGRGQLEPMRLDEVALYMSFFPHLVAGPIVRASEFAPEMRRRADPRSIPVGEAFRLIAFGLFKKVVVSSYLASELVDPVFGAPGAHSSLEVLAGVYGYAIQIYADFSGYTDIAIGSALLLGVRFPLNFNAPYKAPNVVDFWRRWHISLSTWLRDYLYISLGGNRRGKVRTYLNLMITMLLGGLWHGASWTFVVWGGLHGAALAVTKMFQDWRARRARAKDPSAPRRPAPPAPGFSWGRLLGVVATFHFVCACWVFFRAETFAQAHLMFSQLGTLTTFHPQPLLIRLLYL